MNDLISEPRFAPAVSIVVVHWNTPDLLRACLDAIAPATGGLPYEVVVVDNGSRPNLRADLKPRRGLHVVVNETNRGFAAAANQGASLARGERLLFLNTDVRLAPDAVRRLAAVLAADGRIAAAAPLALDDEGAVRFPGMRFLTAWNHALGLVGLRGRREMNVRPEPRPSREVEASGAELAACVDGMETPRSDGDRDAREQGVVNVDWARASVLLVRTDVFRVLGGFDEGFFFYEEDEDFCWRARRRGYEIVVACDVAVRDPGGRSTALAGAWPAMELYRSHLRFVRRRTGAGAALAYRFNVSAALLAKAAFAAAVGVVSAAGMRRRENVRRPRPATAKLLRSLWTDSRETWSVRV